MPKSWDRGSFAFQLVWAAVDAGTGSVAWEIYATTQGDGAAPPVAWGLSALPLTDSANGISNATLITPMAEGAIAGAGEGDLVNLLIYRNAASGADSYPADALLKGLRILYGVNARDDG
jgi:hypothetical protein